MKERRERRGKIISLNSGEGRSKERWEREGEGKRGVGREWGLEKGVGRERELSLIHI